MSSIGMYNYQQQFYTGHEAQPDVLHIFVKKGQFIAKHTFTTTNLLGYVPVVGLLTGPARIINAVKHIFQELRQLKFQSNDPHLHASWNAFKNLIRGIVEFIPFTGLALIIFDAVRSSLLCARVEKAVNDQDNIAGIAVDGKLLFTIPLNQLPLPQDRVPFSKEGELAYFSQLSSTVIEEADKRMFNQKITEVLLAFKHRLEQRARTNLP